MSHRIRLRRPSLTAPRTRSLAPLVLGALSLLVVMGAAGAATSSCTPSDHARVAASRSDCVTCHRVDYDETHAPPHVGLFPATCADCHDVTAWAPARAIRHDWFVLRNRHAMVACTTCHTVGFRAGDTPSECVGCHLADAEAVTMPPHAGLTACQQCHTDAAWRPATFTHSWTLDGAHASVACTSCHTGDPPRYAGTPSTCVGCHRVDYDASPYPGHATFPTTCGDCHTTSAWRPAVAGGHPESAFPIARGAHARIACLDCHDPARGSSTMGMNTDCIGCHTGQHSRARMNSVHREVRGYDAADPSVNFCLSCHPNGRN